MKDYNVQVKVRNNLLLAKMREFGYNTAAELSRAAGVGQSIIGDYLNLKKTPYNNNGTLKTSVQKICDHLYTFTEDIFPDQHLHNPLTKNISEVEVGSEEVLKLLSYSDPLELAEIADTVKTIQNNIDTLLSNREAKIINMRFGLSGGEPKTLGDCADALKVTRERIRQIEQRAFRKLRDPRNSKILEQLEDGECGQPSPSEMEKYISRDTYDGLDIDGISFNGYWYETQEDYIRAVDKYYTLKGCKSKDRSRLITSAIRNWETRKSKKSDLSKMHYWVEEYIKKKELSMKVK